MTPSLFTLSDADLDALPGPIAVPAARYAKEDDPRIKLLLMIDTIETIFKYGSAIVIQAMRNGDSWQDFIRSTRPKPLLQMLGRLQLGEHIGIIQAAYYFLRNNPKSARPSILKMVTPLSEPGLCNALKMLRNRRKGHGAWPSEEVALASLTDFEHNFTDLVQLVKSLNRTYPLYLEAPATRFATQFCGPTLSEEVSDSSRLVLRENGITILGLYPFFLVAGSGSVLYNGTGDWGSESEGAVTFLDYGSGADTDLLPGNNIAEDFKATYLGSRWEMDLPGFQRALKEFTGRANDRRILDTFLLQERTNLILVHGERGVGKTTLLDKWWQNFAPRSGEPSESMLCIRHVIHEGSTLAEPCEIAKSLLHQLDPNAGVEYDWTSSRLRDEIQDRLDACSERRPCLILIDGLDECATKLGGFDGNLFDWIPSPSSTGLGIKWILGLRSHYRKSPEIKSLEESRTPLIHEVSVFTPGEVTEYLRKSLDRRTVDQRPEVLPLVLERTRGLPLNLHLLVQGIREGSGNYSESDLRSFDLDENAILRKGVQQLTLDSGRMEEYLERDEFEKQEKLYSRKRAEGCITLSDYYSLCRTLKADYRSAGEQRFTRLLGLFTLAKEPLTESSITSILEMPEARTLRSLNLASRFLKEEQDGYSFSHVAFRGHIADHFPGVLDSLRISISKWCGDPANRSHGYTIRNGVAHLIDDYNTGPSEEKEERLASLLTDLGFITVKIRAGMAPDLLQDYEQALTCLTGNSSSMFYGLEVDDEDRSWILQNHLARKEGRPVPFPDRGGDLVSAAIQQRLLDVKAEAAAREEISKRRNIAEGRDADDHGDDFDYIEPSDDHGESPSDPTEEPKIGVVPPEIAKELELQVQEMEARALLAKQRREKAAAEAFDPASATARTVAKMLTPSAQSDAGSPAMRVGAFRTFVEAMWEEILDEAFSVPILCLNFRNYGPVREAGISTITQHSAYVESLYPSSQEVRRRVLPFKEYGVDDEAELICFFDGFKKCLRVVPCRGANKEVEDAFEVIDVARHTIIATTHLKPTGNSGICSRWRPLRVSEDGRYGRCYGSFFEIDPENFSISLVAVEDLPEIHALELRSAAPDPFRPHVEENIQITTEDGALALVTGCGSSLDLIGSFTRFGESLTSHELCGHDEGKKASFSENGRLVFVKAGACVCVVDLVSWTRIFLLAGSAMEMAHTPDGRLLATDSEGDIKIWDVASGRIVQRFASAGRRTEMHFSRSGELFYVRGSIYDLRTGPGPATSDLASWADQFTEGNSANYEFFAGFILSKETSICYSPNLGTRPQLWEESREPKLLHLGDSLMFAGDRDFATASFLPSGAWTHYCPLECFDWTSVELKRRPKHKRPWLMQPVKSAHTEVMLLPYPDGFLFLIDLADGGIRPINSLDYLAAMDVTVGEKMSERYIESRWELQEREKNERWPLKKGEAFSPEKKVPQFYINAAVISDDGQWILTATHWDAVRIWDVTTGRCVRAFTLPPAACHFAGHVEAISLTPDGGGCYLALQDGTTHLLECWQKDIGAWRMILRLEGPTEVYCSLLQNRRFAFRQTNSRDTLEIHDLLTSAVISLAPLSRRFGDMKYYDNNLLVTPDDLHMVMAHGETLVVFTLEGLQEITRYPLPAKVKSLSNMTRDGRFVVHTEAGDLLRLKLHLPEG